jgi:glycosyltransferase involved in cell wall biosynthesis
MDDDLQHPPEEILKLIATMEAGGVDVVIGRYIEKRHAWFRNLASWLMKRLSWYTLGVPRHLELNSFRLLKRQVAEAVVDFAGPKPRIGLIICQITRRIVNVDVEHHARRGSQTTYRPHRLLAVAIDNIVYYSSLPLRLLAYGGFLTSGIAAVLSVFYLVRYMEGDIRVMGFTTLVILLLFFMGMTMCAFGIVGEYLIRLVWAAERRPSFVIRQTFCSRANSVPDPVVARTSALGRSGN